MGEILSLLPSLCAVAPSPGHISSLSAQNNTLSPQSRGLTCPASLGHTTNSTTTLRQIARVINCLCLHCRIRGPDVVVDMKLTDIKDALPEGFTPVQETMDTKETAMRKRRLCVKISPRAAAETAVFDIQIIAKSKYHLVNYSYIGEINNMGIWYRMGDVPQQQSTQDTSITAKADAPSNTARQRGGDVAWRGSDSCRGREESSKISAMLESECVSPPLLMLLRLPPPQALEQPFVLLEDQEQADYEHQSSGSYTRQVLLALPTLETDGPAPDWDHRSSLPTTRFQGLLVTDGKMQQVNLMGITIKSLAEIEEEFHYNFSTE
ncbi:multivesicular body subunit 12B-like isoform X1, partial [Lates japonicus]